MRERSKRVVMLTTVSIFVIFLVLGCGGKIFSDKPQIPEWYLGGKVGYIVGTGSAPPNKVDLNSQKDEAMANARGDLAKNLLSAVIAKDKKNVSINGDGTGEKNLEFRTKIITKKGLANSTVIRSEFMDNGTLFVQIGIEKDILNEDEK